MKGFIYVLLLCVGLALSACSNKVEEDTSKESKPVVETNSEENEPTQEELNEKLKEEATQANFVELNVDNPPDGKKVFIEGEITKLWTDEVIGEFTLTSKEGEYKGMYNIRLMNTTNVEYSEGDEVRIYGAVDGKDETGMPQISATVLELNNN